VSEQATKPQEKALRPNQGLQLTASAGALKIAGILLIVFPFYRCGGRRAGS